MLFTLIVVANCVFFVYWTMGLVRELRGVCRHRCTRFYLCLCLCHNQSKLKQERREAKIIKKQESTFHEIDDLIHCKRGSSPSVLQKGKAKIGE